MNRVREIVKASYAHGAHIYGAGSCIAILDSGISPHPDFSGRIVGWHDVLSSTRHPYDDYGHGTHVAGIAAGSGQASRGLYRGIAPRADLVAVKVLNRYGEGTVENICTGIDWVLRNRMRYGINIVNISAGTAKEKQFDESSPLVRKVEELWDAGLVVVVSAGNRGPEAGTITIGGVDVSAISDQERRTCISCVEQYFSRVPGTVLDQITLGDPQITEDMAKNAAHLAGIDAAIQALPEGYATVCTEGMFSQGEWQLLSIARVAAADPAVLLLDEITANLDAETEERVLEALRRASEGRTVLSVSHRVYENLGGRTVEIKPQGQ